MYVCMYVCMYAQKKTKVVVEVAAWSLLVMLSFPRDWKAVSKKMRYGEDVRYPMLKDEIFLPPH